MITTLKPSQITTEVKEAVYKLIGLRIVAKDMRNKVDAIAREILEKEVVMFNDFNTRHGLPSERILNHDHVYMCEDEEKLHLYYTLCDKAERGAGIKPDDMIFDYCPALVAENEALEQEWKILDLMANILEIGFDGKELNHRLLCTGLEKRQQFIDLTVKLVLSA